MLIQKKRTRRIKNYIVLLITGLFLCFAQKDVYASENNIADENGAVKFNLQNIQLAVGESTEIYLDYVSAQGVTLNQNDVKYSLSNDNIRLEKIWNGKIVGLKAGDCIITATYHQATISINVHVYADDIEFDLSKYKNVTKINYNGENLPKIDIAYGDFGGLYVKYISSEDKYVDDTEVEYSVLDADNSKSVTVPEEGLEPGNYIISARYLGATTKVYVHIEVRNIKFDVSNFADVTTETIDGEEIPCIKLAVVDGAGLGVYDVLKPGKYIDYEGVTYQSSNKKILKIDEEGAIECLNIGDNIVTATYKGATARVKIYVYAIKYSLDKDKIKIRYKETANVRFVRDDGLEAHTPIEYATSDKNVATYDFDKNTIIAQGAGNCKITFKMDNGQMLTCNVTVPELNLEEQLKSQKAYMKVLYGVSTEVVDGEKYTYSHMDTYNRSKKTITYIEFSVFQYDNKGSRINVDGSDYEYNESVYDNLYFKIYVATNTKKIHVCIKKVYYSDDTSWTNPLYTKWAKKYINKF